MHFRLNASKPNYLLKMILFSLKPKNINLFHITVFLFAKSNLGGLDLSGRGLDRDYLHSFKKLVSTIKKSWFCLDTTIQIQISRSRSRFIETYQDLPKISIISWSQLRSSYNFHKSQSRLLLLIHFTNRHLWKDVTFHRCLLVKIFQKCQEILINLKKSQQSWFISTISINISTISIYLNNLNKYLDKDKSRLKNLDREKKLISTVEKISTL
jgi:hypothetical protein